MLKIIKNLNFKIIPVQIFIFAFWFKNGFIDKLFGITVNILFPKIAYHGDSWAGWESYITGNWDKSWIGHLFFTPIYPIMFPLIIVLQCLPAVILIVAIFKGEFLDNRQIKFTQHAATASLFITSVLLFSQTLTGSPDGQYLWQLLGLSLVVKIYLSTLENMNKNA
ncbi:hypothetical protein [Photobacterium leiognathi]|uniref:hypothetical protein n=1 Tax=Photobacterium leiognathi TaxID=553611 RepID=UPI0029821575|nr:hypothetical protein [Photobacterium leiognathi]